MPLICGLCGFWWKASDNFSLNTSSKFLVYCFLHACVCRGWGTSRFQHKGLSTGLEVILVEAARFLESAYLCLSSNTWSAQLFLPILLLLAGTPIIHILSSWWIPIGSFTFSFFLVHTLDNLFFSSADPSFLLGQILFNISIKSFISGSFLSSEISIFYKFHILIFILLKHYFI